MPYGHRVGTHKIRTYPPIATIYVEFFFCSNVGVVLVRQFVHFADHFFSEVVWYCCGYGRDSHGPFSGCPIKKVRAACRRRMSFHSARAGEIDPQLCQLVGSDPHPGLPVHRGAPRRLLTGVAVRTVQSKQDVSRASLNNCTWRLPLAQCGRVRRSRQESLRAHDRSREDRGPAELLDQHHL